MASGYCLMCGRLSELHAGVCEQCGYDDRVRHHEIRGLTADAVNISKAGSNGKGRGTDEQVKPS